MPRNTNLDASLNGASHLSSTTVNGHESSGDDIAPGLKLLCLVVRDLEAANELDRYDWQPECPVEQALYCAWVKAYTSNEAYTVETVREILKQQRDKATAPEEKARFELAEHYVASYSLSRSSLTPEKRVQGLLIAAGYTPATAGAGGNVPQIVEIQGEKFSLTLGYPLDDIGNGQRFASQHGHRVRWCEAWDCWLIYDGKRWIRDDKGKVEELAKITARLVMNEVQMCDSDNDRAALLKHAATLTRRAKRETMLKDAKSEAGLSIEPNELDADKWLFNVQNGTLDLRTGKLLHHNSEDLISKIAPVVYHPSATFTTFEAFVFAICGGNSALVDCLQRQLGYSLTGDTKEQNFVIGHGSGSNGKSTLLQTILELMGDYGIEIEPDTIMIRRQERMAVDIADLHNVRFVVTSESNDTQRLDEGKVKKMTGGEQLTGERKFEHPFKFWPQFKLFLATNHLPEIRGTDEGIWRRVMPIPFDVRFWREVQGESGPDHLKADPDLRDALRREFSGILNWLLEGCRKWQQSGLTWPEEVRRKKNTYREEQDIIGPFLSDCCVIGEGEVATAKALFTAYENWCELNSSEPVKNITFGKRLKERNFKQFSSKLNGKATRQWQGLRLKTPDETTDDPIPEPGQHQTDGYAFDTVTDGYANFDISGGIKNNIHKYGKCVTICNQEQKCVTGDENDNYDPFEDEDEDGPRGPVCAN